MTIDTRFLDLAFRLGDRQLGRTGSRPAVGCVLVKDDVIIGVGATGDGGAPHAEVAALRVAGARAVGADAYVSLEPCAHFGKTPPCADALSNAGIRRAIVPFTDPDPRVQGLGFERLRLSGIEVIAVAGRPVPDALDAFFTTQQLGRPRVTVKMATSLDGKIALGNGVSQWITAAATRRFTRALRGRFGAIAVGIGTILADDPQLDARIAGQKHEPRVVIYDRHLRTPLDARILARTRPIIFCAEGATNPNLAERAEIAPVADLPASLRYLLRAEYSTLLIEGGAILASAFLRANLADRLLHAKAPVLIGADARDAFDVMGFAQMDEILRGEPLWSQQIGGDRVSEYRLFPR